MNAFPSTLVAAAAAIASGKISSEEMTLEALDRAEKSQTRLNAFIEIERDAAVASAKAADAARGSGSLLGPLHGVPLAHKDMYDRKDRVTSCGSKIRLGHIASTTSTVMERLEAAGSFSIGRLNMSEFAMGPTGHNFHYGRAINPIDASCITGGSSSGSGAAVGGGVVLAALGSDTGGSIRLPAACCGIVGIKPTQGRVSRHGVMPLSFSQDCVGPLARTVEDAMLLLRLISGPDGRDTTCRNIGRIAPLSRDISTVRIGIDDSYFADGVHPEVLTAVAEARLTLSRKAAAVSAVRLPDLSTVAELANAVAMSEAGAVHFDWMRDCPQDYGPQVRMRLSQGLAVPAPIYLRALQVRAVLLDEFVSNVFAHCDALLVPAMPFLPPRAEDVDVGAGANMNTVISDLTKFTRPFSYLGLPVVTLPIGRSATGLPVAAQIVAPPWREDIAATVGAYLEDTLAVGTFLPDFSNIAACVKPNPPEQ